MTLVNTAQRLLTTGSNSVFVEIQEMIGLRFLLQRHDDILADAVDNFLIEFLGQTAVIHPVVNGSVFILPRGR